MEDSVLPTEEYENVKKFYKLLNLSKLGEPNQIYNFQDIIILCEIFEQRASLLQKIFKYNPRNVTVLAASQVVFTETKVNERTLIGGFTCVNTRLAFDTDVLLNDNNQEKVLFDIDIDGKKQTKRVSCKTLKMDENNQYGMTMTKPLPYRCIKKQDTVPSLTEFNRILDKISHEDKISHLFTVDIKFHNINEKTLLFNEIYPPIFEKNKKVDPYERSTLQLFSIAVRNEEK